MSLNASTFTVASQKNYQVAAPQPKKSIIGTMAAGAVLAASGTGGFGNKQTSMAFALPKIIYKDILVHCVHVSVQEY